jgi:hypothetical protein
VKGGIQMTDTVNYALKFGPIGGLMHSILIKKRLEEIFDFRQNTLSQIFFIENNSLSCFRPGSP